MCQTRSILSKARLAIGVLTPYTGGFYYGAILEGIQKAACARGVAVIAIQTTGMDLFWPSGAGTDYLSIDAVDGWIAVNEFSSDPFTARLVECGIPLVYVNARPDSGRHCSILPDNFVGMKAAVAHLIEHGHRRIAFAGQIGQFDLRERYAGYLSAHRDAGLDVDPSLHLSSNANLEMDGCQIGRELIERGLPCTAVAAGTDKLALGVLSELRRAEIEVPGRIAIVGFDDIDKAKYVEPPLTTVKQSFGEIAALAFETLVTHLETGEALPEVIRSPTAFIVRKSCGCQLSESLPPLGPRGQYACFEDALASTLLWVAGGEQLAPVPLQEWPATRAIADLLVAVERGTTGNLPDLNPLWSDFFRTNRSADSVERIARVLEQAVRQWYPESDQHGALQRALRELRVALLRNWRNAEEARNRYYEYVAETNGKINQALSVLRSNAAVDLSWLRWTNAQYACLGLWCQSTLESRRQLQIVGEYGTDDNFERLGSVQLLASAFPPASLCDLTQGLPGGAILTLVPLLSGSQSRGVLAVVSPVELELLDHVGNVGDWARQIGTSLERAEVEQQLRQNADHDALTGLPNRRLFLARLQSRLQQAETHTIAVGLVDLDDFRKINDSLGHHAGDQLLFEVSRRLREALGDETTIARMAGDEFAFFITNLDEDAAVQLRVAAVHEASRAPFSCNADTVFVSCSIGVALGKNQQSSAAELLRDADTAMHRAKLHGRSQIEVFHHDMHAQAVERLRLDTRLRWALKNDEFVLVYQPIVSLATGHATGAEALIRWNHPEHGCLMPSRFLAVAEDVGLAVPIGEWVIRTACREARTWQREGHSLLRVNVNVSTKHLEEPLFVEFVRDTLRDAKLPPQALSLELVESSLIEHRELTTQVLDRLSQMGVHVAIDDFGTGYSSLSYLRDLPVNILKIDRTFVENLPDNSKDRAIAIATITMGRGLGLTVVAEGVQTKAQLEFLQAHGCDLVQGFLLSRPIPASECERVLRETRFWSVDRMSSDPAHVRAGTERAPGASSTGTRGLFDG